MVEKVLVFIYPGCAEFEVAVACWQIAERDNYEITTISYDNMPISTGSGFVMICDELVAEIKNYDSIVGIIIPGGTLLDLRIELQRLLQKLNSENKMLAAICAGPQYLAASGVLQNRVFTTSRTPERYLELNQSDPFDWNNFREERVVLSENLITAKGYAFSDFALAIWEKLGVISGDAERLEWRKKFFPIASS